MLIEKGFEGPAKELYDRLCEIEFDADGLRKDLEAGKYDADAVNLAALNYVDDCDDGNDICGVDKDLYLPGETRPGFISSHLTEAIRLLLDFGLDHNRKYKDVSKDGTWSEEYNIMDWLRLVWNGYQGADSLYLLLEHGGDPDLTVDGENIFHKVDFDLCYDIDDRDSMFDHIFDAVVHYWMVYAGFGAKAYNGESPVRPCGRFDPANLRFHREYYYGVIHSEKEKPKWELCFFYRHNNWEVARAS